MTCYSAIYRTFTVVTQAVGTKHLSGVQLKIANLAIDTLSQSGKSLGFSLRNLTVMLGERGRRYPAANVQRTASQTD